MVEFNNLQTKHLIVASTCVAAGIWYFIRNRGKSFRQVHVSEEYHQSQFSEWLSRSISRTFSTSKLMGSEHPEGPNLGFKSNNSWFSGNGESTAKIDLLHQGHTKGGKLIIVLVGLPGRGKTYIARKIARYLRWIAYRTRAFSLAKYRLDKLGSKTAAFFDPTVASYAAQRQSVLVDALEDALK
jgi:hypothetical protein